MKDRLLKFLSQEQLTSKQFASLIGVQPSSVSHILSGRNKPSFDFMEKIALNYPSLSLKWLITGRGSMFIEPDAVTDKNERDLFSQQEEAVTADDDEKSQEVTNVNSGQSDSDYNSNMIERNRHGHPEDMISSSGKGKKVEKIVVMFCDRTFSEYFPEG